MKKIALINDLSGFGRCSLTAAIPVISVMGIQACPLPTAILSAQTGFSEYFCDEYTDRMDEFTKMWKKMGVKFEGIYSGYLAGSRQVDKVLYFLEQFKHQDTLYLVDPVMGDGGEPYDFFSLEFLQEIRVLTAKAEVITPNLTELCLLTGEDYENLIADRRGKEYQKRIQELAEGLLDKAETKQQIIVTGIVREQGGQERIGNLAVSSEKSFYIETPYTGQSFSGTGDLFASVICGSLVKGFTLEEAMKRAVSFLEKAIKETSEQDEETTHGVYFEKYLSSLI